MFWKTWGRGVCWLCVGASMLGGALYRGPGCAIRKQTNMVHAYIENIVLCFQFGYDVGSGTL